MEERVVIFDKDLSVEAYQFKGIKQKFPNHFHEFYVLGFIEKGQRFLSCKGQEHIVKAGDLLLLNPYDNHYCEQIGEELLDYRSIHLSVERMHQLAVAFFGAGRLPVFKQNVVPAYDRMNHLKELHYLLNEPADKTNKETCFYACLKELLSDFSSVEAVEKGDYSNKIMLACEYITAHYSETVSLEALSSLTKVNQFTLIRQFIKLRGVTPHQYLVTTRIGAGRKLLEKGVSPAEAAIASGFSDQSHFTRYFKNLIGVTPKQYMNIFYQEGLNEAKQSKK